MKKVFLYGALAKEFGKEFMFDVQTIGEALRALECNFHGKFFNAIKDGRYRVSKTSAGNCLSDPEIVMQTSAKEIHIIPVLKGGGGGSGQSKGKAIGTAVLGVALIVFAAYAVPAFTTASAAAAGGGAVAGAANFGAAALSVGGLSVSYASVALTGVALTLSGVSSLLASDPRLRPETIENRERPDARASFIFNGAVNRVEQGGPVTLVYGQMLAGSIVLSASIDVQDSQE